MIYDPHNKKGSREDTAIFELIRSENTQTFFAVHPERMKGSDDMNLESPQSKKEKTGFGRLLIDNYLRA